MVYVLVIYMPLYSTHLNTNWIMHEDYAPLCFQDSPFFVIFLSVSYCEHI